MLLNRAFSLDRQHQTRATDDLCWLHLAIACRDPGMAVLGPDPAEPGRCGSPCGPLRGPVHGARARTVVRRCSRHASYGCLPSVAGHGPWPTARRGQWPEAAFAATARSCRVGGSDAARGSPAPAARPVARRRDARPGLRLSFVTHLRYKELDRLFPFPHRLLHAASA